MARQQETSQRSLRTWLRDLVYPINLHFLPYQRVDAGTLKIIAAVTMFIDHLTYAFLELPAPGRSRLMDTLPNGVLLDAIGRLIGRTAMPIFAFLIVEGYVHTRSRGRYLLRLVLFAFLSEYPFKALFFPYDHAMHCDTLFTLSLGLVAVWAVDRVFMRYLGLECRCEVSSAARDSIPVRMMQIVVRFGVACLAVVFCCMAATRIGADYRYGGVITVLLFYLFRGLRPLAVVSSYAWLSWYNQNEIYSVAAMVLIQCYNGRRGRQLKYLFYLYYPGHLLLLLILRRLTLGF